MTAGLKFESAAGTKATNLDDVKIITLTDGPGNEYTLDSTGSSLKLKYKPKTGNKIEHLVNDLVSSIRNLLTTKTVTIGGRETTLLEEEAGKSSVAKAVLGATSDPDGKKSILVEKLGGFLASTHEVKYDSAEDAANQTAKDFLAGKFPLVKTDGSNATKELATAILTINGDTPDTSVLKEKVADKNVAEAILGATSGSDGKKSILVEKLGDFLEKTDEATEKVYGDPLTPSSLKVAKDFLNSKGLGSASASDVADKLITEKATELGAAILDVKKDVGGTQQPALETDLAANENFQTAVAGNSALKTAVTTDTAFKNAVTSTLSRPEAIAAVPTLKTDVATQLLTGDNKVALATEIASKAALKEAITTDTTFKNAVTSTLSRPEAIAAVPALKTDVATQLLSDANKDKLGTAILGVTKKVNNVDKPALKTDLAADADLQTAVKTALASDTTFQGNVKITVNSNEPGFQGAVREVMSKPVFEIPADDNAPLSLELQLL